MGPVGKTSDKMTHFLVKDFYQIDYELWLCNILSEIRDATFERLLGVLRMLMFSLYPLFDDFL